MQPLFIDTGITEKRLFHVKKVNTPYLDRPFHFHPNCEMVVIEEGYGKRVIGDNVSTFHEGDLVLMGPNLPHIWTNDDIFYRGKSTLRAKAMVIYFSPVLLDPLLDPQVLKPVKTLIQKSMRGLVIKGSTKDDVKKRLAVLSEREGLAQLIEFLGIVDVLARSADLRYLSSHRFVNTYSSRDTNRINAVYQFLLQHFKEDIHLDEVAEIAHMAPTAFCRFFKQSTQKTFSRFLNELRIRHACDLLQHPDKTIMEVAYESGYHNMTNFNKCFKAIIGRTPSAYRKKIHE